MNCAIIWFGLGYKCRDWQNGLGCNTRKGCDCDRYGEFCGCHDRYPHNHHCLPPCPPQHPKPCHKPCFPPCKDWDCGKCEEWENYSFCGEISFSKPRGKAGDCYGSNKWDCGCGHNKEYWECYPKDWL